jgi:hypothetical protein
MRHLVIPLYDAKWMQRDTRNTNRVLPYVESFEIMLIYSYEKTLELCEVLRNASLA